MFSHEKKGMEAEGTSVNSYVFARHKIGHGGSTRNFFFLIIALVVIIFFVVFNVIIVLVADL